MFYKYHPLLTPFLHPSSFYKPLKDIMVKLKRDLDYQDFYQRIKNFYNHDESPVVHQDTRVSCRSHTCPTTVCVDLFPQPRSVCFWNFRYSTLHMK